MRKGIRAINIKGRNLYPLLFDTICMGSKSPPVLLILMQKS